MYRRIYTHVQDYKDIYNIQKGEKKTRDEIATGAPHLIFVLMHYLSVTSYALHFYALQYYEYYTKL